MLTLFTTRAYLYALLYKQLIILEVSESIIITQNNEVQRLKHCRYNNIRPDN